MAQNTYVWVGFFEENSTETVVSTPRNPGIGRIIVSVVASANGRRYKDTPVDPDEPHKFGSNDYNSLLTIRVKFRPQLDKSMFRSGIGLRLL